MKTSIKKTKQAYDILERYEDDQQASNRDRAHQLSIAMERTKGG